MGGRGSFASGNNVSYKYEMFGKIEGVKVLQGKDSSVKGLPVHEYKRDNFADRTPRLLTKGEYEKYKKYFLGVNK